ncbi:exodeoxyribonuclease VII large subunit [Pontibacillus halophilus JSM 076056 = DSM 19796]|uniref:Exodeoxyribonuclease 7 large subunit n=1 Tax=Pontibacillus halophilus JSM 076056 = DSM 19796 TaxID=1385510 RepID=A0A0A5I507_9BACI|nr:exodeoxyribonuclease VII large subunit [Pontibacillus halophilus]KGX90912.1 exodeoxyribonuclease VII large subunit [Pontibacillus halophilus JSM 076056 = DSM 19796]
MKDRYLTVTALTKYIKRKFETDQHLREVWLRAEISNFKQHSRGHMYLTLKDQTSRVSAVMFSGNNKHLKFTPENGMNVLVKGEISVYEPVGQYQLYIRQMEPDGVGALYLAYEELKKKLSGEGLFEEARKKPIPKYPNHIAIITSPTGAAIRDIITTIKRRYPLVKLSVLPVSVQGPHAAPSVVKAIQHANELDGIDVIITGRGGGSIEELWAFNEESVARSIANSEVPIISAVGHETDYTISDFVADLRAPTPTGAAEMAVPSREEVQQHVQSLKRYLHRVVHTEINQSRQRLQAMQRSYAFRYPAKLMQQKEQDLDRLMEHLQRNVNMSLERKQEKVGNLIQRLSQQHPERQIELSKVNVQQLTTRNQRAMKQELGSQQQAFGQLLNKLNLLNPLEIMQRGYAIPFTSDGSVVKTVQDVQPGDSVQVRLKDGVLDAEVRGIAEEDYNE